MPDDLPPEVVEAMARALWDDSERRWLDEGLVQQSVPPAKVTPWDKAHALDHEEYREKAATALAALPACVLVSDGQGNMTFSTNTGEWEIAVCSRCGQIDGEWICNCHSDREFLAPLPDREVEDVPVVRAPG